ncbi:MAG: RNA-binding protein [bacterium]|nr:RNA-binding protein [bacterium]
MKKIYVGNLSWSATEADLRDLFGAYGEVQSAAVVTDRETGRSRGFGFVEMAQADAEKAISELDGQDHQGRALRVNEAQQKERGGGGGGGGGGGRGRY